MVVISTGLRAGRWLDSAAGPAGRGPPARISKQIVFNHHQALNEWQRWFSFNPPGLMKYRLHYAHRSVDYFRPGQPLCYACHFEERQNSAADKRLMAD